MELLDFLSFFTGIFLLLVGCSALVRHAIRISLHYKVAPFIIGATIVAIGTSLPEFIVSLVASFQGDSGLAMGNIVGSNISNILLILPIGILIGRVTIADANIQNHATILAITTGAFLILQIIRMPFVSGILLLIGALFFTLWQYHKGGEENHITKASQAFFDTGKKKSQGLMLLFGTLGAIAAIGSGGYLTVTSVEAISRATGFSTTILGLSLTAIATSLPELFATVLSQRMKEEHIAMGNIMGSNMYNLLLIGGVVSLSSNFLTLPMIHLFFLIGTTVAIILIAFFYKRTARFRTVAIFLLLIFFLYLSILSQG